MFASSAILADGIDIFLVLSIGLAVAFIGAFLATINPYNPTWLFNLGMTLDQLHRHDEAIEVYQQVIEINPNDLDALGRLGADQAPDQGQ